MQSWKMWLGIATLLLLTSQTSALTDWPAQPQAVRAALHLTESGGVCAIDHVSATALSFFSLLGAGLLTGLSHCMGMCGPLVGAFTLRRRSVRQDVLTPLVGMQMGRITTYALMGATAGTMGAMLNAALQAWQGRLAVVLGLVVIALGLGLLGLLPLPAGLAALAPAHRVSVWMKNVLGSTHPFAPFGLGLANGLLPCGPVYAMALLAAMSGNAFSGASLMLVFGLGTLPAMLGFSYAAVWMSIGFRARLFQVAALVVVAVGLQLMLRGLALDGYIPHTALGQVMLW